MLSWISDFRGGRTFQVRVGQVLSEVKSIENGTPQGSVISPVLFKTMNNDIFECVGKSYGLSLFVDD